MNKDIKDLITQIMKVVVDRIDSNESKMVKLKFLFECASFTLNVDNMETIKRNYETLEKENAELTKHKSKISSLKKILESESLNDNSFDQIMKSIMVEHEKRKNLIENERVIPIETYDEVKKDIKIDVGDTPIIVPSLNRAEFKFMDTAIIRLFPDIKFKKCETTPSGLFNVFMSNGLYPYHRFNGDPSGEYFGILPNVPVLKLKISNSFEIKQEKEFVNIVAKADPYSTIPNKVVMGLYSFYNLVMQNDFVCLTLARRHLIFGKDKYYISDASEFVG